ncbi:MAG: hypothetical protein IJ487_00725, partial [Ruminococcus sp.]|nr:hypothetical protein [Ruminococcus sp.]
EGDEVAGIGDSKGTGSVTIVDSTVNMKLLAGTPKDIGTVSGDLQVQNSIVNALVNNKRVSYSN